MSNQWRKNCALFITNLDPTTSDVDLISYFQKKYTGVTSGKIVRDLNGRSKGHAFINFTDFASANRVIQDKNHLINGQIATCRYASPKKKKQNIPKNFQKKEPKYLRELYIGNVNTSTTNQQLKEYFEKYGSVINAYIICDENKRSKGYGFVEFQSSASVEEVQEKRPHQINGQEVQTVRTYPKEVPTHLKKPTTVLYVLNYNENVDEENIEEYFSQFGDITMVSRKVKRPEDIEFMELQFDDYDAVDNICLADNHTINNCAIMVTKYMRNDVEKWVKPHTETVTHNTIKSAENSSSNSATNSNITKNSPSASTSISSSNNSTTNGVKNPIEPTIPSLPAQDLHQSPHNPHFVTFVSIPEQPLYPNLQSMSTTTNYQPSSRPTPLPTVSSSASSGHRATPPPPPPRHKTATNNPKDKDCHIL
ncbi:ribonucleoprotein RB97D-like [Planococcus citri]|uniref:ribonucleoprotein RB97D-like n=1 Tax=Planococcus citri TaxID=170843 RepID=UPI0031F82FDA